MSHRGIDKGVSASSHDILEAQLFQRPRRRFSPPRRSSSDSKPGMGYSGSLRGWATSLPGHMEMGGLWRTPVRSGRNCPDGAASTWLQSSLPSRGAQNTSTCYSEFQHGGELGHSGRRRRVPRSNLVWANKGNTSIATRKGRFRTAKRGISNVLMHSTNLDALEASTSPVCRSPELSCANGQPFGIPRAKDFLSTAQPRYGVRRTGVVQQ